MGAYLNVFLKLDAKMFADQNNTLFTIYLAKLLNIN